MRVLMGLLIIVITIIIVAVVLVGKLVLYVLLPLLPYIAGGVVTAALLVEYLFNRDDDEPKGE